MAHEKIKKYLQTHEVLRTIVDHMKPTEIEFDDYVNKIAIKLEKIVNVESKFLIKALRTIVYLKQ